VKREEKKQLTKERICQAAMSLFADKGYEATKISEITDLAGVAKGTFFNYFESKEEVMLELHISWVSSELHVFLVDPNESTISTIRSIGEHLATRTPLTKQLARTIFLSIMAHEKTLIRHQQAIQEMITILEPILRDGQASGEITNDQTPAELAEALTHAYFGAVMAWAMHPSNKSQLDHVSHLLEWFCRGIANQTEAVS
jgi:AcrR family transcriptional regulator